MGRSQSRRTTPSKKGQQRQERDAMLRLLMHAVDKAGGTLTITAADRLAMPAAAELRSSTNAEGAQVLTLVKPKARHIEVKYAKGNPDSGGPLPQGLQELLSAMDPRPEDARTPYHQSATTDALQATLDEDPELRHRLGIGPGTAPMSERIESLVTAVAIYGPEGARELLQGPRLDHGVADELADFDADAWARAQRATGPGKSA